MMVGMPRTNTHMPPFKDKGYPGLGVSVNPKPSLGTRTSCPHLICNGEQDARAPSMKTNPASTLALSRTGLCNLRFQI